LERNVFPHNLGRAAVAVGGGTANPLLRNSIHSNLDLAPAARAASSSS
jgi:hypothetical protein